MLFASNAAMRTKGRFFLGRRRIHQNRAAALGLPAEIAAETGVATGRCEARQGTAPQPSRSKRAGKHCSSQLCRSWRRILIRHYRVSPTAPLAVARVMLYYPASFFSPSRGVRPRGSKARRSRKKQDGSKLPLFRKKFPLLVTGGLLALQPLASLSPSLPSSTTAAPPAPPTRLKATPAPCRGAAPAA